MKEIKKIVSVLILLVSMFFLSNKVLAAGLYEFNERGVYRSSAPDTAVSRQLISTGSVYIPYILVASTGTGGFSTVTLYNSSTTNTGVDIYTSPTYTTSGGVYDGGAYRIPIDKVFGNGLVVTNTGGSKIEIYWDWIGKPPEGQRNRDTGLSSW